MSFICWWFNKEVPVRRAGLMVVVLAAMVVPAAAAPDDPTYTITVNVAGA